ncbi:hypothetical protein LXL04_021703 [Taraxacum kok-saghyz]
MTELECSRCFPISIQVLQFLQIHRRKNRKTDCYSYSDSENKKTNSETKNPTMASMKIPQTTNCKNGCTMCFNDYHLINERSKLPRIITQKTSNNALITCGLFNHLGRVVKQFWPSSIDDNDEDDEVNDLKNNSCEYFCEKKVGFFGRRCDCGGRFCGVHRLPEEHACKYTAVRDAIEFLNEKSGNEEIKNPSMASVTEIPQTTACKNGCGFSGKSPARTKNLCSMCFNDYHLINERSKLPRIITQKTSNNALITCGLFNHLGRVVKQFWPSSIDDNDEDDEVNDLKNNSCEYFCEKKVGFFGRRCDCGGRFCGVHRLPEEHACKYTAVRDAIEFLNEKSGYKGKLYVANNWSPNVQFCQVENEGRVEGRTISKERKKSTMASVTVTATEIPQTTTCDNGCGFSGYFPARTKNLCYMCFHDYLLINESSNLPKVITRKSSNKLLTCGIFDHVVGVVKRFWQSADDEFNDLKNNCCDYVCDKKVGFFGRRCGCGGRFCGVHRLPEEHACRYTAVREAVDRFLTEKSAYNGKLIDDWNADC